MEDFRTEGSKILNLNNMHLLCIPKGKQLEYFVEKTVEFLRSIPKEPLCYRRLLKDGYGLQKVSPGAEMPKEQRKPKDECRLKKV